MLKKIRINDITTLNRVMYAGGVITSQMLGVKAKVQETAKKPCWQKRLESQVKELRKDFDRVKVMKDGGKIKKKHRDRLQQKYRLKEKGENTVLEVISQRIKAKQGKINRYNNRISQYQQNRMFQNNEGNFYRKLNGAGKQTENEPLDAEEAKKFWQNIWSVKKEHNKNAEWLSNVKSKMNELQQQEDITITKESLQKAVKKLPNWKAPGSDGLQGYWIKAFKSLHGDMERLLNKCLGEGWVPSWMTKGRTVLIQKDLSKGNVPSNYRPITCLPMMWKILTGIIADCVYESLDSRGVLTAEQKGCKRGTRGTHDLIYIDKMVLREVKRRRKNLAMCWIDYRKAYDMVPHSWIIECLDLFKVAKNVRNLLTETMEKWCVELTSNGKLLGEVNIKRGIFQGDTLSPLLFAIALIPLTLVLRDCKEAYEFYKNKEKLNHLLYMDDLKLFSKSERGLDSLINTVRIFSADIKMEFEIEKCTVLIMKRGTKVKSDGIVLPDAIKIKSLDEGESYKYLGVLEDDRIKHQEMKDKVSKEYLRRVRKVLESKLNSGNLIKAINTWAVSLFRYTAAIIDWRKEEIMKLDQRTRKLLTMHKAHHPKDSVHRLYISRKEGGRGPISIENCVEIATVGLENYIQNSTERLIIAARGENKESTESVNNVKQRIKRNRKAELKEKKLHGQFLRDIEEVADEKTWNWMKNGHLKRETESLIIAAQDQVIRTNAIKAKIDKTRDDSMCRMCNAKDETITHIISECPKLAQKEYKRRHDWMGKAIHWDLCRKKGFATTDKWYEHEPQPVTENEKFKILWDFTVQTDHIVEARRPDMMIIDKEKKLCLIVDFAVPSDHRIEIKEREKIEKYQDLKREVQKLWNMKAKIIPIVIGALGTIPKTLQKQLEQIESWAILTREECFILTYSMF